MECQQQNMVNLQAMCGASDVRKKDSSDEWLLDEEVNQETMVSLPLSHARKSSKVKGINGTIPQFVKMLLFATKELIQDHNHHSKDNQQSNTA